jgi:adenylosuccinate synthase
MTGSRRNLAVLGAQWGDEGKGKIVDLLCEPFDVVARYHGGHNAGHTVRFGDKHFSLHLIPSGILHPEKLCILGNGMVIDPQALLDEAERLRSLGVVIDDNLKISDGAHVILPWHRALDQAREAAAGEGKIGTTGRGIGPAYESKASRAGIVVGDLLDADILREKIRFAIGEKNDLLSHVYGRDSFDADEVFETYLRFGEILRDRITDTTALINGAIDRGQSVMFEGAQGTFLDIDHGTYPFVTSSSCVTGGISIGLGIAPKHIHSVTAVAKAYTTRVGSGPFPTELHDEMGERIRKRGNEYGTTTGRPRRTGWLDLVVLRTAKLLNGIDRFALTKIDVLDDLDEIPVCTGYRTGGKLLKTFPRTGVLQRGVGLELRTMKGWKTSTVGMTDYGELPPQAQAYVRFIEEELEVPVSIISTGPRREETIVREAEVPSAASR